MESSLCSKVTHGLVHESLVIVPYSLARKSVVETDHREDEQRGALQGNPNEDCVDCRHTAEGEGQPEDLAQTCQHLEDRIQRIAISEVVLQQWVESLEVILCPIPRLHSRVVDEDHLLPVKSVHDLVHEQHRWVV